MLDAANDSNRIKVRDMLGSFLFRGDDVEKKVKVLSGGERNRLALCKMLLSPINVLLMDEPTNHLDIKSKNVLKTALRNFKGTLILVSHDRDFLQGLTEFVYEFKDQKIKEYLGDINYFLEERNAQNMREIEKKENAEPNKETKEEGNKIQSLSYEDQKKIKSLQNRLSKIENEINELEKKVAKDDSQLAVDYEKLMNDPTFFTEYENKKHRIEKLMIEWEEIQEELI
jgi:ATP-binding cassette subfamily F protein 3